MELISILIRLLISHFLGDFLLQSKKGVKHKNKYKITSKYLYLHVLIHGILAYVLVGQWTNFLLPIIVMILHYFIDLLKIYQIKNVKWFLVDQLLHVLSLFFLWIFFYNQQEIVFSQIVLLTSSIKFWIVVLGYIFVLNPTAFMIYYLTKKWQDELGEVNEKGLTNAGKWIGILERILILTFILVNQFSAVGFLLAAKSIFRFGDLTQNKSRKLTEYVLIGTLLSFAIAIIIGLLLINI
ncbi:MAG: DUF3307 domain-containing protein [Flavobacteriaceae bacterium]|nr:DUF3307 domain-containing protein [Flavobacteriaceae bacterium]